MKPLAQNTLIQNRYLIVHLIGKGGMGEVYLAVDQRLGSAVALKRTFFAGDEMLGNAFEREARTLARMRHPVLPKVSDHFGENDEQFLVMEHISGDDLSKRLVAAGKPFPMSWVLYWADQLLDALSYLHTHEPPIIHRDIKPQNLKLTDENHIILLDFGLSKTSTGQTNISQSGSTGSVVGYTPHYAPMEQIRGIGTSPRSDLYSLSATLYQLMTNTIPVDALSRADSLLNGMPDPIKPPTEINPEVPKIVSDVILRGMEVSQEKRFSNAREMQRVLRKAFNEIQAATSANTVAFTAVETEAFRAEVAPTGVSEAPRDSVPVLASDQADAPAIEPDASIDLDATMAYGTPFIDSSAKQADVKTEVLASGNSNSLPPSEVVVGAPTVAMGADEFDGVLSNNSIPAAGSSESPGQSQGFDPNATVPFIAVDEQLPPVPPATMDFAQLTPRAETSVTADRVSVGEAPGGFTEDSDESADPRDPEAPYLSDSASKSGAVAAAAASSYAVQTQATPADRQAKSSTGKVVAIFGAIAGVFLLVIGVGGGIWAYMNYGPGNAGTVPTPEPTADDSQFASPSPEATVESGINADTGNSNSDNSSVSNVNSDNTSVVEPTPEPTAVPETDSTPATTRPTPRGSSPPRQSNPQGTKSPPKQKPVTRPTVLP